MAFLQPSRLETIVSWRGGAAAATDYARLLLRVAAVRLLGAAAAGLLRGVEWNVRVVVVAWARHARAAEAPCEPDAEERRLKQSPMLRSRFEQDFWVRTTR